jgi:hypothetical protein
MIKMTIDVSDFEAKLITVIQCVEYGEIEYVDIVDEHKSRKMTVDEPLANLIKLINCEGIAYIDKIIVHQSVPVYIVIEGEDMGFKYKRKYKLN